MKRKRPTFIGIGAHKGGTTWLFKQLVKHHEVWMPPVKELHFFDRSIQYPSPNKLATSSPIVRIVGSNEWERPQTIANLKRAYRRCVKRKKNRNGKLKEALWWGKWTFGYYNENWYVNLFSQAKEHQACGEISPAYSILEKNDVARIKELNSDVKIFFINLFLFQNFIFKGTAQ